MRDSIEKRATLERLGRIIMIVILCVLVIIGSLAVISVSAHAFYVLWKGLT